jgi:hypothetical protein
MARLYWRVKVNGKWTWRPAVMLDGTECGNYLVSSMIRITKLGDTV